MSWSAPIAKWSERLVICGSKLVQKRLQLVTRVAEHDEALPLNHARVALAKGRGESAKMRYRGFTIFVAFVHLDYPLVIADEPLIGQNPPLSARRGHHFARELLEIVQTT